MSAEHLEIRVASPERQIQALWLVFSSLPTEERTANLSATLADARAGRMALKGLFAACRGPRLVGSVWGCALPGRQAAVWPARLVEDEPESTAGALHERLAAALAAEQVRMLQSLVPEPTGMDAMRLVAAGFQHVADLQYLVCTADQFPSDPPQGAVTFEAYRESAAPRLARLVEETYHETLDCPGLNGVRDTDDVLTGYRRTGEFASQRWLIVRHGDRDVGCLLLADHPDDDQWELVYMGIIPAARGRGWGLQITRHAQWLTGCAARGRLILAVDAANQPAVAMYTAAGFQIWNRRSAFVKSLTTTPD